MGLFTGLLTHEIDVLERDGTLDRMRQPAHASGGSMSFGGTVSYPARITAARGGKQFVDRSRDVVIADFEVFVEPSADISETDWVRGRASDGSIIMELSQVVLVRPVTGRDGSPHHVEVLTKVVRGA